MTSIKIGNKERSIPENWNEMTLPQLCRLVEIKGMSIAPVMQKIEVFKMLANVPKKLFNKLNDCQLAQGIIPIEFLFNSIELTQTKIKNIKIKGKLYSGGADCLDDCSFVEYIKADSACKVYEEEGSMDSLDLLAAIFLRPVKKGKRLKFDDDKLDENILTFKKFDYRKKVINYIWFRSCQAHVASFFPHIFNKKSGGGDGNWIDVLFNLAGSVVNIDKTGEENIYNVLYYLSMLKKQSEKMK